MKNTILVIILINISFSGYSQVFDRNFERGVQAMENGNFEKSIFHFSKSLSHDSLRETFFNRAICYYQIDSINSFCSDLYQAKIRYYTDASKLFDKKCYTQKAIKNNDIKVVVKRTRIHDSFVDFVDVSKIRRDSMIYFITNDNERVYTTTNCILKSESRFYIIELLKTVKYPEYEIRKNEYGLVSYNVTIDTLGNIFDVKLRYGVNKTLNTAVLEGINTLGKFKPMKLLNGELVNYQFPITASFGVDEYEIMNNVFTVYRVEFMYLGNWVTDEIKVLNDDNIVFRKRVTKEEIEKSDEEKE